MTDVLPPNRETSKPTPRLDARAKVTGEAKYAGEHHVPGLHYGVAINSAIARGRIRTIDVAAAAAVPGVVKVYTHESRPGLSWFNRNYKDEDSPKGTHFAPLYDDEILYSGQPIALVVAETFETARYAATLIRVEDPLRTFQDLAAAGYQVAEPNWMTGYTMGSFWALSNGFTGTISQFSSLASAAVSAPTPGSSGSSGFGGGGGGGFSGGGGGGGGGGGW